MALTVPTVGVGDDTLASWADAVRLAVADLYAVVTDTTIGSAAAGWTTQTGTVARTALGGKLVYVTLVVQRAAALTVASGNVAPDEDVFTLDAAYRPAEAVDFIIGTGTATGDGAIATSGAVTLRSMSDNVAAAANYRGTVMFLLP